MTSIVLDGAGDLAVGLLADVAAQCWSQVCQDFDSTMAARLDAAGVEEACR